MAHRPLCSKHTVPRAGTDGAEQTAYSPMCSPRPAVTPEYLIEHLAGIVLRNAEHISPATVERLARTFYALDMLNQMDIEHPSKHDDRDPDDESGDRIPDCDDHMGPEIDDENGMSEVEYPHPIDGPDDYPEDF